MATDNNKSRFAQFFGGKEPSKYIFEDEQCVVFDEENCKQARVHFLVVPKRPIPKLMEATEDQEQLLGHLLIIARRIAEKKGINKDGFRVVMNEGTHSCQSVEEFYVQVLGGRRMLWPFS